MGYPGTSSMGCIEHLLKNNSVKKEIYSGDSQGVYSDINFERFMDFLGAEKILCHEEALRYWKVWFFQNVTI